MKAKHPAQFLPYDTTAHCTFSSLENLVPADAQEGGLAKLLTAKLPNGQTIAIKRFHGAKELDEPLYRQHVTVAESEFDRMAELDGARGHAPLAYALGTCTDENGYEHPAIAMQFIEGFTLEYALKSGLIAGSGKKADKTRSTLQTGLHIAHAMKACGSVVHRDMNPRNVMLVMDRWGEVKRAVLIDFGQSVFSANPLVTPSAEPHRLATISFGAPEVYGGTFYFMRNNNSVDAYSLGALLYYLRTRKIPYLQESALDPTSVDGAHAIVEAKREAISVAHELGASLRPIDHALDELAKDCMAFDPRDRPTVDEIYARIERALGCPAGSAASASRPASASGPIPSRGPAPTESCKGPEDPGELLKLAENYYYGHEGKPRSKALALQCLVKAAEAGNATAQLKLGRSYSLGLHGVSDADKARHWLESARALGHPGAAATLRTLSA